MTDAMPDLTTADDLNVGLCTIGGAEHDWRPYTYTRGGMGTRTSWRCVWCHAVRCGDYDEPDGCVEPYHHHGRHRAPSGETWPLGGDRRQEARP